MEQSIDHSINERLHPLDALRGIAAFVIAFTVHAQAISIALDNASANEVFVSIFSNNFIASIFIALKSVSGSLLRLFFVLSGFIFAKTYSDKICKQKISLKTFLLLRFSRLFPIYWVTLVITAVCLVIQIFLVRDLSMSYIEHSLGSPPSFVTALFRFVQSAFLVQGFGITETFWTFNGPAWTLTFEMYAYLIFFIICFLLRKKIGIVAYAIPILIGCIMVELQVGDVAGGWIGILVGFFCGCVLYDIQSKVVNKKQCIIGVICAAFIIILVLCAWAADILILKSEIIANDEIRLITSLLLYPAFVYLSLNVKWLNWFLSLRPFRWLGVLSYSMYIWHFPLAIILSLVFYVLRMDLALWQYVIWIVIVLGISHISYFHFEIPIQRKIRNKYYKLLEDTKK